MMKKMLLIVFILFLAVTAFGCGQEEAVEENGGESLTGPPYLVTIPGGSEFKLNERTVSKLMNGEQLVFKLVNYDVTAAFFEPTGRGVKDAASEFGVSAEMVGPTDGSSEKQLNMIETLIESGVDGLSIIAADSVTLTPIINKAFEAGIPVVTSNIDAPDSLRFAFFGQELVESGVIAGNEFMRYFREVYPKQDGTTYKVALFGSDPAYDYVRDRIEGFKQVVGQEEDIEFIGPFGTTFDNATAYSVVESVFQSDPDVAGIYMADGMIVAGGTYLERNGLSGKVIAVGFNFEPGTEELLKSNAIQASVGQKPYAQGYEPIKFLFLFLTEGELPAGMPFLYTGAEIGNQENLDTFDFSTTR